MPRRRTAIRKIREVVRLRPGEAFSLRLIYRSLSIPVTNVGVYVRTGPETPGIAGCFQMIFLMMSWN